MNRRAFLGWLAGTAAGVAAAPYLDLDKLLWIPGEKTIFVPPVPNLTTPIALTVGDIFTIDGVFAINPQTGRKLRYPQQFVITSNVQAGAVDTFAVFPRIYPIPQGSKVKPLLWGTTIPMDVTQ